MLEAWTSRGPKDATCKSSRSEDAWRMQYQKRYTGRGARCVRAIFLRSEKWIGVIAAGEGLVEGARENGVIRGSRRGVTWAFEGRVATGRIGKSGSCKTHNENEDNISIQFLGCSFGSI